MFWELMTVLTTVAAIVMGGLAACGEEVGIGAERRSRMRRAAVLMVAWALACYGHHLVGR
jgi:hypothetical protein